MKKCMIFLTALMLSGCGSGEREIPIQGKLTFDGTPPDSVYVGLYNTSTRSFLGEPVILLRESDDAFEMQARPGTYTLAVFAHPFEPVRIHMALVDQSEIIIHAHLPRLGLPENIREVKVYGEFSQWQTQDAIPLHKKDGLWVLKKTEKLLEGQEYIFWVDGQVRWNPAAETQRPGITLGRMHSVYPGGVLVLDPSLYRIPGAEPEITVEGLEPYTGFEDVLAAAEDFDARLMTILQGGGLATEEAASEHYKDLNNTLDSLKAVYRDYEPLFADKSMGIITYMHPVFSSLRGFYQEGKLDSTAEREYLTGDEFQGFLLDAVEKLRRLDLDSPFVNGEFHTLCQLLESPLERNPAVMTALDLKPDFFFTFYLDFADRSPNRERAAGMLYRSASNYSYSGTNQERAEILLKRLKSGFAETQIVSGGYVDQLMQSMKMKIGTGAPAFSVVTLSGDEISLSDFLGRFVMIDFWGSWCGPCRGETPNFIRLHQSIPAEELQVIGLANDDREPLEKYIKEHQIPYPNALAPEEVLNDWGITAYPTTFLIDPEGKILAKNLRGPELVTLVREKMEEYRNR